MFISYSKNNIKELYSQNLFNVAKSKKSHIILYENIVYINLKDILVLQIDSNSLLILNYLRWSQFSKYQKDYNLLFHSIGGKDLILLPNQRYLILSAT